MITINEFDKSFCMNILSYKCIKRDIKYFFAVLLIVADGGVLSNKHLLVFSVEILIKVYYTC